MEQGTNRLNVFTAIILEKALARNAMQLLKGIGGRDPGKI
jgi:hypothetical protein